MNEFRPLAVVDPQRGAAESAKVALTRAATGTLAFFTHHGMVHADVLSSVHFESVSFATQVDGIASTALGFSADTAVAALIGIKLFGAN